MLTSLLDSLWGRAALGVTGLLLIGTAFILATRWLGLPSARTPNLKPGEVPGRYYALRKLFSLRLLAWVLIYIGIAVSSWLQ